MQKERRYDLDWLRVMVFGLLILYHVGMFFVPWGWHIKNNELSEWLQLPMLFVNQWRLPILFVISGMGTRFALSYRSQKQFIGERLYRLLIPLIFGMLVIIPPQVFIERIAHQQFSGNYADFYTTGVAFQGIYPEGNFSWHHLWFLPYLLVFSLVLSSLFIRLRNQPDHRFLNWLRGSLDRPWNLYIFIVPLYFAETLLEPFFPSTHALWGDWFNLVNYGLMFLFGYLLISVKDVFWKSLANIKKPALVLGIICFPLLVLRYTVIPDNTLVHFVEGLVKVVNLWSWILVLFAYGAQYLNQQSAWLAYCNRAVYPFYILHQTITIIIGYFLMDLNWNLSFKFLLLTLGTFAGSALIYELLIRRIKLLWPVFGLKAK